MEKDKIGARLKEGIKERGFKQEEFAEKCGISYPALKRYMSGKNAYSYELLMRFADVLECSYDYLLGKSKSFKQEHHEVTEQTRLSEEAIANVFYYAKDYDNNFDARRFIKVLDLLLREETAFSWLCDYMVASKPMDDMNELMVGAVAQGMMQATGFTKTDLLGRKLALENTTIIRLVMALKNLKDELTPEFIGEIKKLELPSKADDFVAQIKEGYTTKGH